MPRKLTLHHAFTAVSGVSKPLAALRHVVERSSDFSFPRQTLGLSLAWPMYESSAHHPKLKCVPSDTQSSPLRCWVLGS